MKRVIGNLYTLKGAEATDRTNELKKILGLGTSASGFAFSEAATTQIDITGSATTALKTSTGTFVTGINLGGTLTTGVTVGACTTAYAVTGTTTTAVSLGGAATTGVLVSGATTTAVSVTGNATDAFKVSTGTVGTGLNLGGTLTTGISIGACTTGITIGNVPTGIVNTDVGATGEHLIDMVDAYAGMVVETGTYASTANKGVKLVAANNRPVSFLFDDGGAALVGADYRAVLARTLLTIDQSNAITLNSFRGHLKALDGIDVTSANAVVSPITAYLELEGTGARTLTGHVAGFRAALEEGASGTTTVAASSYYAGIEITLNSSRTYTLTGSMAGLLINTSGGTAVWNNGILIPDSMATTGISIGSCTSALTIANAATNAINIAAAASVTNLFKFNAPAGCILNVDVNPKDIPSTGGLGADACIRIDVGGSDYFIPIFAVELS